MPTTKIEERTCFSQSSRLSLYLHQLQLNVSKSISTNGIWSLLQKLSLVSNSRSLILPSLSRHAENIHFKFNRGTYNTGYKPSPLLRSTNKYVYDFECHVLSVYIWALFYLCLKFTKNTHRYNARYGFAIQFPLFSHQAEFVKCTTKWHNNKNDTTTSHISFYSPKGGCLWGDRKMNCMMPPCGTKGYGSHRLGLPTSKW